jgi:hypothetical protein
MKPKRPSQPDPAVDPLTPMINVLRGQRVILDADLARIYGVATFRFNEAFKRNRHRFPADFAFQLTAGEFAALRAAMESAMGTQDSSQSAMSSWPPLAGVGREVMSSQFARRLSLRRGAAYRPWAFTEHGALMAANILHSERATHMAVYVVRAFVQMREQLAANAAILKRLAEIDKTLLEHDSALRDVYRKLLPLLQPPPEPPKRRIGFNRDTE